MVRLRRFAQAAVLAVVLRPNVNRLAVVADEQAIDAALERVVDRVLYFERVVV